MLEADCPYWIYRYERPERPGRWTKVLQPENTMADEDAWPVSRYAHQVVYDVRTKTVYMHGGNARLEAPSEGRRRRSTGPGGEVEVRIEHASAAGQRNERLDDFWEMKLIRCVDILKQREAGRDTNEFPGHLQKSLCARGST